MNAEEGFAQAAAALTLEAFEQRVSLCDDVGKLRATIEYEIERRGDVREERVAVVNKRLARLT